MNKSVSQGAWRGLGQRYLHVFRQAWAVRHQMDGVRRTRDEASFLPAALSLQETPVSPLPRVTMWLIVSFALVLLLWSIWGRVDVVATAEGRIIPSDRSKTVQPMETALVKAIHVRDGQDVLEGEVLVELDPTLTGADVERLETELCLARLQKSRGESLLLSIEKGGHVPPERVQECDEHLIREAQRLSLGQYVEFKAHWVRLESEKERKIAERGSVLEAINKLEKTAPLAGQRADAAKNLVGNGYIARHDYLSMEQTRIELEGELAIQRSRLRELDVAVKEVEGQLASLHAETRRVTLDLINEGLQKSLVAEQELIKAKSREGLTRLVSPVSGTVQQLAVHTIGGVVTPAQPVLVVVPRDNPMEIEAFVLNKDIGFVRSGQDVEIKVETFPYTRYGTLHGRVKSVSHDAINDEKRGLIYSARVQMAQHEIMVDGVSVPLSAGMSVSVEIKTGFRRVIEYFLAPLLQYSHESLRER
ncbi:MAG: HlyD family type I secretion periplasmic adaptor subunit [Halothiobacillaceae bacterium]|nr:HlyD family type I secretion periplasmic adaptor subunit [Halothiobacillaceae bacterium]